MKQSKDWAALYERWSPVDETKPLICQPRNALRQNLGYRKHGDYVIKILDLYEGLAYNRAGATVSTRLSMTSLPFIRQQSALLGRKPLSKQCLFAPKTQRRGRHHLPVLAHSQKFVTDGVGEAISPDGFDIAWTQYQGYTVQRLNELTVGGPDEARNTKDLIIQYARLAEKATLFNHASMAYNNYWMFSTLTPTPKPLQEVCSRSFIDSLNASFSSLDSLRETFLATASSTFGPGFTWLIKRNDKPHSDNQRFSILNTYLAGSPFPGAHYRKQAVDMATSPYAELPNSNFMGAAMQNAGAIGQWSKNEKPLSPGGVDLDVMMCVSTWEHTWLRDWGVAGKREFLEKWWECIDWGVVEDNAGVRGETPKQQDRAVEY